MSLKSYFIFIQLPALILACSSDIGGSSSKSAEFGISFFAPLSYTYPLDGNAATLNQSPTADVANNRVKTDLNLAIGQGLTANQIYLYIPPTLNFTFTPPSITIADGNKCTTDKTYVAISGTVIYKCVGSGVTASPVTGATDASTDSTTTGPSTSTGASSGSTQSSSSKIKSTPFIQSMTVTATASQPLYENQWNQIARSVQKALEAKQMLFDDEIQVALL